MIDAIHKSLGKVKITQECLYLQSKNDDPTAVFVEHDNEIKEVSKHMVTLIGFTNKAN